MAYNPPTINSSAPFGNLPKSGEESPMTSVVGSYLSSVDGSASPKTSPQTFSGNLTLAVPKMALQLLVCSPTTFNITEDSSYTAYFAVPANFIYTYDCWKISNVYLQTATSQAVSYQFRVLV